MANAGFSAATSYFGTISNLTPKESSQGAQISVATAESSVGEVIAHDEFAEYDTPSTTYALTGNVTLSNLPALGSKVGDNVIVTQIVINTNAGQPPTVTISGQEVPSAVTSKRTYTISSGSLEAKCKAQDPAGGFTAPDDTSWAFNSVTTTFTADVVKQSVKGEIKALCVTKGRVEVSATAVDPSGTKELTESTNWLLTSPSSISAQDEGYINLSATATKWLTGTDAPTGVGGSGT